MQSLNDGTLVFLDNYQSTLTLRNANLDGLVCMGMSCVVSGYRLNKLNLYNNFINCVNRSYEFIVNGTIIEFEAIRYFYIYYSR